MKNFLLFLFLTIAYPAVSQDIISGKVASQKGEPLAGANVYIPNTAIGTVTDATGSFVLRRIPSGNFRIAVSFIGYEVYTTSVASQERDKPLQVTLVPRAIELESVIVRKYVQNGWSKWGNIFTEAFVGASSYAANTRILNHEVIRFIYKENDHALQAFADEPIIIENKSLGYKIAIDLVDFLLNVSNNEVDFQVYSLFTPLEGTEDQAGDWKKKRREAYAFSMMHFMRTLHANQLKDEGFDLMLMDAKSKKIRLIGFKDIARKTDSNSVILNFTDNLIVTYKRKIEPLEYYNHRRGADRKNIEISDAANEPVKRQTPFTVLTLLEGIPLEINENGYFKNIDLMFDGFWGWWEKLATKLPYDYLPQ